MSKEPASRRRQRIFAVALALTTLATVVLAHLPFGQRQVGFACDRQTCWAIAAPPDSVGAPFTAGTIDLTGDGVPEIVQLEANEIRVLQDDIEIWRSDPAWRVVDIALGDPNDDGRHEILAALWKPNDAGVLVSHPYIIAHRGGTVKLIWGGSAVTRGIHELELVDVDGDGVQELLVLEAAWPGDGPDATQRSLAVWDWHGWGFNLRWRSEVGRYQNLGIAPHEDGDIIVVSSKQ